MKCGRYETAIVLYLRDSVLQGALKHGFVVEVWL
jgi:hypothetical protein